MATSIFTYEFEPPRVSSPWLSSEDSERKPVAERSASARPEDEPDPAQDDGVKRLDAEPQDGPIEYKLHLLLRPRRNYDAMSTVSKISGSRPSKLRPSPSTKQASSSHPAPSSSQTRQNRLANLTTQLLWRLQQSVPYHANAKRSLVIPKFPEENDSLEVLEKPQRLFPGLEGSNGALYEIGVSDDGTFVGLTKDEMDESMTTLKIMSASLGCRVEVQRMKIVGSCEWVQSPSSKDGAIMKESLVQEDLWVAEALVVPILQPQSDSNGDVDESVMLSDSLTPGPETNASSTQQLRVSLVGPTTSGKTTLLGTLANGSLDNGRGSSRINLLKHRHEVASGQTSSVAQELIGYKDSKIINYADIGHIKVWTDIHDYAEDGRLVFFSDSAGHLRFRRTIMRGLVGWAPHWTLLCIPANSDDYSAHGAHSLSGATDNLGNMTGGMDLAISHLDLCLRLEIPMVIIITKYDLATKEKLRNTLNPIFSRIKAVQRTPKLLLPGQPDNAQFHEIPVKSQQQVNSDIIEAISQSTDLLSIVPVILTSAVTGRGVPEVHALLNNLPIPPVPTARDFTPHRLNPEQPASLFHVDDKYELALGTSEKSAIVVAGYLRFGSLSIGDKVVIGPFPADDEEARRLLPRDHPSPDDSLSVSHPSHAELARIASRNAAPAAAVKGEWRGATIVNIRNLRLPVRTMEAGQAGTVQIVFDDPVEDQSDADSLFERSKPAGGTLRKGQVLAIPSQHMLETGYTLQAASGLKATFRDHGVTALSAGSLVNVYVATVRAAARILRVSRNISDLDAKRTVSDDHDDVFNMAESFELEKTRPEDDFDFSENGYTVSLEFLTNREWIELGSRVIVMEGGKQGSSGLEGYVGTVVEMAE